MTQFLHNGSPISDEEMHCAIVHFSINGYTGVPLENLKRIAARWPNIGTAKAPSPGTETMLAYLIADGYDWRTAYVSIRCLFSQLTHTMIVWMNLRGAHASSRAIKGNT